METVLLFSTVIDLGAVAVLAWLVWRSGTQQDVALGVQRASLESLRTDLAALVADAERRAQGLEEALGERERRLRELLADLARVEAAPRPGRRANVEAAAALDVDPAEARLRRELEMSFGRRRA